MYRIVLDTNVIVSALWSPGGPPARILAMLPAGRLTPYYDYEIMREYQSVLMRPKFKFSGETTAAVIEMIERRGYFVTAPTNNVAFADESDRKFYDVARFCGAALITGNERHFPREPFVMSPADFLARL